MNWCVFLIWVITIADLFFRRLLSPRFQHSRIPVKVRKLFLLLLTFLVAAPALAVELKGQIKGVVLDTDGLAIPGAVVVVSGASLQGTVGSETDSEGRFRAVGLPPGYYVIEASKPGFQGWKAVDVRVAAGATVTLEIPLRLAVSGEEIVVEEDAPVVDITSTQTGTILTSEMLRDLPNAGRDYQTAMSLAAGVVGGGNPYVHGAFSSSNQYYLDGVNTTDPLTNTFSMNMNFDAIEEIQVITGGLDAEYGKALGAAVNIITKSGGNELEGNLQFLYSSDHTRVYKPLADEEVDDSTYADQSLALNLGGPIVRDRLWFFTSLQLNYNRYSSSIPEDVNRPTDENGEVIEMAPRLWKSAYLFGKLTWKPTPNHQIWFHMQSDPTWIRNVDQSVYEMPEGETYWEQGGWLASLGHQWTPGKDTVVNTQAYYQSSHIKFIPQIWKDECTAYDDDGMCLDDFDYEWFGYEPDSFTFGPSTYWYYTKRQRASFNSKLTQYFDFLGEHEVKTGVEAEFLRSYSIYPGLSDGYEIWSYGDGDPTNPEDYSPYYKVAYDSNYEADLIGMLASWFVQDVWHPVPRLTIRPGVRVDMSRFLNDVGNEVFSAVTVAPRFGVAYDLFGDNSWKFHTYYGRFYDVGYLGVSSILTEKKGGYSVYYWDDAIGDWGTQPDRGVGDRFLASDQLKNPWSDEINAGVTADLGDGWALDTTFIYEKAHNFWEDDDVNLIWNAEGTDVIGYRNGTNESVWRLRTPDETYTEYTALEFSASRQFGEKWGVVGTYTWSHAYGTQGSDMATGNFDIPEQIKYEEGILSYDIPHYIKFAGSYRDAEAWELGNNVGMGYLLGWDFNMRSGYRYRKIYYNSYYDGWNNYGDDGDDPDRLPAVSTTDLKAGITLAIGQTTWDVTAECFNVFNSRTVTGVSTVYDDGEGGIYLDENGDVEYGSTTSRLNPRYFQFGLRGEF